MPMGLFALEILLGFFAALGLVYTAIGLFDAYVLKRAGVTCRLWVVDIKPRSPEQVEYAVRILQGVLAHASLGAVTSRLLLSNELCGTALYEKLFREYGNVALHDGAQGEPDADENERKPQAKSTK